MIVDWGSSYGLQPFLDDLAPFLIVTPEKLDLFSQYSVLGQRRSREEMLQWLALSAFAKFAGFFVYIFDIQKESGVPWDASVPSGRKGRGAECGRGLSASGLLSLACRGAGHSALPGGFFESPSHLDIPRDEYQHA